MSFPTLSVATTGVMVDRSAVTYFQHFASGTVEVVQVKVACDSKVLATTTIDVGVLTEANETYQDVAYFDSFTCILGQNNNGLSAKYYQEFVSDYSPGRVRLSLNRGTTTGFTSDNIEFGTNNFPTGQFLRSPAARKATSSDSQRSSKHSRNEEI